MTCENTQVPVDEIRSAVKQLAEKEIPKFETYKADSKFPNELFREIFANAGLTGATISTDYDGLGLTPHHGAAIMEELAAVDLGPAIFLSVHFMVAGIIEKFGSAAQKSHLLPKLASGEYLGAFALTEPQAGSDAANLRTTYTEHNAGYNLNGEKCYITSAGSADIYLVFARKVNSTGGTGIACFVVEATTKGLTVGKPEKKLGCELSPIASLSFSDARIPKESLLGEIDRGYSVALSGLAGGRINIASCANGLSRTALNLAVQHLEEREQFGQKLIELQGLQFMLADMAMKLDAAKLLTERAAIELVSDPKSQTATRLYPSMAKCFATDAAMAITTDAVQLLGGAGYIKEYRVEQLMRDAKMLQIVEGTNQIQRGLIARALRKDV